MMDINAVIEVLMAARGYVECCCEEDRSDPASEALAKLDAMLTSLSEIVR